MIFKTQPYAHQLKALELSKHRTAFALFMEARTGKSKVILDTTAYLYEEQKINALLIIAPNGVHLNWTREQIPIHLSIPYQVLEWRSSTSMRNDVKEERAELLKLTRKIPILAVNIEALRSDRCFLYLQKFLQARKTLLVIDESQVIKTPGAKQTKRARALALRAPYRRILTGTPAVESPFDLYSQCAFLDAKILGFTTFAAFKARYGVWSEGFNHTTNTRFPKLEGYCNEAELTEKLAPHSFRVRRDECADLPPKTYQKVFFELTPEQLAVYRDLVNEQRAELQGRTVTVAHQLTLLLRLQQVACNHYPGEVTVAPHTPCDAQGCEQCGFVGYVEIEIPTLRIVPREQDPRLLKCIELIKEEKNQIVIWARFRHDIHELHQICKELGESYARYDGTVGSPERDKAKVDFQKGRLRILLANPAAAGRGLDLSAARLLIYYSNSFSLEQRLQSEDRAETMERDVSTRVVDLIAVDTVDEYIVEAHRAKEKLSRKVAGDPERKWL